MNKAVSTPALAAVVALRIPDFLRAPVAHQIRMKARLESLIELALAPLAPDMRLVLDAPHGHVIVVLTGPGDALALAQRIAGAMGDFGLSIGIDYGPVRAVDHERRGAGVVGDGIIASMAVAAAAAPGQVAVSQPFRDALEWSLPGRSADLAEAGAFTDGNSRRHAMFALDRKAASRRQRRWMAVTGLGAAFILALGVGARALLAEKPPRPAVLEFAITPRGEIVIDGIVHGPSPPLTRVEVPPGARAVEIRAPGHAPLKLDVTLASEQAMTIRHAFPKARPKPKEEPGIIGSFRRRLGI